LDAIRLTIMKSLNPSHAHYNPKVGMMNIDFLLSIYVFIQKSTSKQEGDDPKSIYHTADGKHRDLVDKNREKDEVIK